MGRALELLAFETKADLTDARRLLTTAWAQLSAPEPTRARPKQAQPEREDDSKVRQALSRFDQSRGGDLTERFRELEKDLGLQVDGDEDDAPAPDFPGVVGAMLEEYRWDRERAGERRPWARLAPLAEFARSIGVFEELSRRDLVSFASFWLLERDLLQAPQEAVETVDMLADFCRWAEEEHCMPLDHECADLLQGLRENLPRVVAANRALKAPAEADSDPGELYILIEVSADGNAVAHDRAGDTHRFHASGGLPSELRSGDRLRARINLESQATVLRIYPPEVGELEVRRDRSNT
ncbi:MAG: hypothetical protein R3F17_09785 [Planctomycetota bacterium]